MAKQKVEVKLREFICGNKDGRIREGTKRPNNATYNVCRIGIPEGTLPEQLLAELRLWPQVMGSEWPSCPAVKALRHSSKAKPASAYRKAGLGPGPGHRLEVIRNMEEGEGFVICRLGVPRTRMVEEVEAKLHPGYRVVSIKGDKFVEAQADGTKKNNVNTVGRPWPDATVCPIAQLTAC